MHLGNDATSVRRVAGASVRRWMLGNREETGTRGHAARSSSLENTSSTAIFVADRVA